MKRIAIIQVLAMTMLNATGQTVSDSSALADSFYLLSPVEVRAIRASDNAPFPRTNLSKKMISRQNLGQDVPFILSQTPSFIANSDAGNGIGYTGMRIRGTDATRINVTLNGIPYNDAESQGTFFVDLPDFSSSVGSIQVIRGVGTSSNGAGAFGASINFSTNELNREAYGEINNSFGSFNSWKHTIRAGTGILGDHFTIDARLSKISSDGYIDRATSDLESFYFSTAYLANNSQVRVNVFSGNERTYQAWNGVSESDLKAGNRKINYAGMEKPGEPYDDETDNFRQDHYQLFFDHKFSEQFTFNTAVFLTRGKGYYEQYKAGEEYADYGQPDPSPTVTSTDLVRQLWLDNYFYGNIFSLQFNKRQTKFTLGGGWTRYDGDHFGKIIWAQNGISSPKLRWYDNDAKKTDLNIYFKHETPLTNGFNLFYDLQYRHVDYNVNGFRDNPGLTVDKAYDFFNPKLGFSFIKNGWKGYAYYGVSNKEPNRDDFEAGMENQPKRERLNDIEWGVEKNGRKINWAANFFYMDYQDQLVLTGKINDVGAYTRTNIKDSYRLGAELLGTAKINSWVNVNANLAISSNKVRRFQEFLDDYDLGGQKSIGYEKTDLAYSPAIVGGGSINLMPAKGFEVSLTGKYVGKQYLDNTSNENRTLDAFYTQDAKLVYTFSKKWLKEVNIVLQLNNIFNKMYEPNGYTFSYIYGGEVVTENYYFPMAGRNFMVGMNVRL